jgi:hypothetical protein
MAIVPFLIASLAVLLPAGFVANRVFMKQPLAGALLFLCLTLIQITGIELILGIINQLKVLNVLLLSLVTGFLLVLLSSRLTSKPTKSSLVDSSEVDYSTTSLSAAQIHNLSLNRAGITALILFALILLIPLYSVIAALLIQIFRVHPLSWDVVSYHLPNAIDYLQTHSFWTGRNFYNQYPGGNEILQIWSFLPLKLDALLGLTTAVLGLGILLTATLLLKNVLPELSSFEWGIWTILLWILCLAIPPFQDVLFDFGRNDITIAFWVLVAIWTLQQATSQTNRNWWLIWTGISLGLAVGVKPTGLFYVLGFIGLVLSPFFPIENASNRLRTKFLVILKFLLLPTVLIGSFWYIRNIIRTGMLSDQALTKAAAELSIARTFFNPNLYQLNLPFIFLLTSILITVIATGIRVNSSTTSTHFKLLTGFNWVALTALILTPSGAGYWAGNTPIFLIQIRYGVAIVPVTIILLLSMLSQLVERFKQRNPNLQTYLANVLPRLHGQARSYSTTLFLGSISLIGSVLLMFQLLTYQPPVGLPGFDSILFASNVKPSEVYAWTQKNIQNSVIYSIGLRPYGLYGFPFSNQVIAHLGAIDWNQQIGVETLRQFQPNFVVFSLDPFTGQVPKDFEFFRQQPQKFEPIYQDPLAVVFRVVPSNN